MLNRLLVVVLGLVLIFCSKFSIAHDHKPKAANSMAASVQVDNAWARATFALAKTGAVYFEISNLHNKNPILLSSVSVTSDIASMAQIHSTSMNDGMMQMKELDDGVEIPAKQTANFSAGGRHIMLMGLEKPLSAGQSFSLTLSFSDGSSLTTNVVVKDARK